MKRLRAIIVAVIMLFSLVPDVQSAMLMEDYLKLKNAKPTELFLIGWLDAITWANVGRSGKKTTLFCPPDNLVLNVSNLRQIIEEHYEKNKSMYNAAFRKEVYFGLVGLEALRETFPCK